MLQGIGTLLGAIAVLIAAKLGASTFQSWKREKLTERHIDQAERILTATYKARRQLRYVRSPMMWAYELKAAEDKVKEDSDWALEDNNRKRRIILAQGYFNRLDAVRDEREELDRCLPMARALFGNDLEKSIETLNRQFHIVQIDVESYIDDDGVDANFTRKIRRGMYDIEPQDGVENEVTKAAEDAVTEIERICLPVLRIERTS